MARTGTTAMAAGSRNEVTVAPPPTRTVPRSRSGVLDDVLAELVVAGHDATALVDVWRPRSVSSTPCRPRTRSSAPRSASSCWSRRESADWLTCSCVGGVGDRAGVGDGEQRPEQDEVHLCDSCMLMMQYYALYTGQCRPYRRRRARRLPNPRSRTGGSGHSAASSDRRPGGRSSSTARARRRRGLASAWSTCSPTGSPRASTTRPGSRPASWPRWPGASAACAATEPSPSGRRCWAPCWAATTCRRWSTCWTAPSSGGSAAEPPWRAPCWSSTPSTTWPSGPRRATGTPRRCCDPGPRPSGSPAGPRCPTACT